MVRVLLEQFPKGYYARQRDNGFAVDNGLLRAVKFIELAARKYSMLGVVVVTGDPGTGKCQPAGSKVLMSNGEWKNIEDIKIGDEVISPQTDGTNLFSKVKKVCNWFCKENYDVVQMNRQHKKLYSCSWNHILPMNVLSNKNNKTLKKYKVVNYEAKQLAAQSKDHHRTTLSSFKIDTFKNRTNCAVEPYTLGAWLGDGHFSSKKWQIKNVNIQRGHWKDIHGKKTWVNKAPPEFLAKQQRAIGITSADFEIIEEVSKYYPITNIQRKEDNKASTYRFSLLGDLAKSLTKLGLEGKGSGEKFIPKEALLSDSEYRKKLLAGLIDTDGYFDGASYSICTKSKMLAEDVLSLVYSLGGRGNIRKVKKTIKKINFVGEYYEIGFYLGNLILPLRVKRKIRDPNMRFTYLSSNRVAICLEKSKSSQVYGFELDSPSSLYVTDNWMVTHNSTLFSQLAKIIDPGCSLENCHFNVEDFCEGVGKSERIDKVQVIADDEAADLMSRSALQTGNKRILITLARMRSKKIIVFLMLPSFFDLDRTIAMFYTKMVVRCYNKGQLHRGYFQAWLGNKAIRELYLEGRKTYSYYKPKPNLIGRFADCFCLDQNKYNEKKEIGLKKITAKETYASNRYIKQRNILIRYLYEKENITQAKIGELIGGLDDSEVNRIIAGVH